jgi:hypothetical protein
VHACDEDYPALDRYMPPSQHGQHPNSTSARRERGEGGYRGEGRQGKGETRRTLDSFGALDVVFDVLCAGEESGGGGGEEVVRTCMEGNARGEASRQRGGRSLV